MVTRWGSREWMRPAQDGPADHGSTVRTIEPVFRWFVVAARYVRFPSRTADYRSAKLAYACSPNALARGRARADSSTRGLKHALVSDRQVLPGGCLPTWRRSAEGDRSLSTTFEHFGVARQLVDARRRPQHQSLRPARCRNSGAVRYGTISRIESDISVRSMPGEARITPVIR